MTRHRNPRGEMPFLEHLEELRWRILWSLIAVTVGAVIGFALVSYFGVLDLLIRPVRTAYGDAAMQLIYLSPADPFFVTLRLGIFVGFLLAFPVVVYQIWSFLAPALEPHEKRSIVPALYLGLILFSAGVALAYFIALPVTLEFFKLFQETSLEGQLEINKTLGFIVKLLFAFGAVFELPIVILVLSAMGLVTPAFLREKRRHAIVLITIVASLITPGDVITLTIIMMVPLVLLYELSILMSAGMSRKRAEREQAYEASLDPPEGAVGAQ